MNNQETFELFTEILLKSCSVIEPAYFSFPQSGTDTIYRERVYAYELYHLLRVEISKYRDLDGVALNGEVDKSGRRDFSGEKPDMLLHCPGNMERNIAIVEIKRANGAGFDDAINNLKKFTSEYKYVGGIFLIFGGTPRIELNLPDKCILVVHELAGALAKVI